MIVKVLFGFGMFVVTLAIQFFLYKKKKNVTFWSGTDLVFGMCILGLLSDDVSYLAGILGYVIGDYVGKFAGWHKYTEQNFQEKSNSYREADTEKDLPQ